VTPAPTALESSTYTVQLAGVERREDRIEYMPLYLGFQDSSGLNIVNVGILAMPDGSTRWYLFSGTAEGETGVAFDVECHRGARKWDGLNVEGNWAGCLGDPNDLIAPGLSHEVQVVAKGGRECSEADHGHPGLTECIDTLEVDITSTPVATLFTGHDLIPIGAYPPWDGVLDQGQQSCAPLQVAPPGWREYEYPCSNPEDH
jgi:hypothetical protein